MSAGRVIARLFAVLIILVFVLVLPALVLAYDAVEVSLSPGFLESVVGDSRLYEAGIEEAAADLARDGTWQFTGSRSPLANLSAQDWQRILVVVAPQSSVERWTGDALALFRRRALSWGSIPEDLVLPFGQMRDNLVLDPQQTAMRTVTEAQPPCGAEQPPLATLNALFPSCQPPAVNLEAFYQDLSSRWQQDPGAVWRAFRTGDESGFDEDTSLAQIIQRDTGESLARVRYDWRWVGWALTMGPWLWVLAMAAGSVLVLAVVAALAARNWREVLRWVGGPVLLAGLLTMLLGLLILLGARWATYWPGNVTDVSLAMRQATSDIGRLFADRVFVAMLWQGALIAVIGLVVWLSSLLVPKPKPKE